MHNNIANLCKWIAKSGLIMITKKITKSYKGEETGEPWSSMSRSEEKESANSASLRCKIYQAKSLIDSGKKEINKEYIAL